MCRTGSGLRPNITKSTEDLWIIRKVSAKEGEAGRKKE
jgi:hypothetical protein